VAWVNLGDNFGDVWWSSGPENGSSGGSGCRGSSSKQWLGAKGFGVAGQWRDGSLCCDGGEKWEGGHRGPLYVRGGVQADS
jgi:hypothetical protein